MCNAGSFFDREFLQMGPAEWDKTMAPFKGGKIVTYHNDFVYFADRFGLKVVETLEPKPGIAPSPAHLAQVINLDTAAPFEAVEGSNGSFTLREKITGGPHDPFWYRVSRNNGQSSMPS